MPISVSTPSEKFETFIKFLGILILIAIPILYIVFYQATNSLKSICSILIVLEKFLCGKLRINKF